MIEKIIIIFGSLSASALVFYVIKQILLEGVKDEVNLPLANCDTSMFDEIRSEEKNEKEVLV